MSILSILKTFWPLIFTFLLPRGINYYRALKTAYRTRPPPRPLPSKAARSLNILFASICFWLVQSLQYSRGLEEGLQNVFATTGTRLLVPIDVLFSRLAMLRPEGVLTSIDELLKARLVNKEYAIGLSLHFMVIPCYQLLTLVDSRMRYIYLRYGPSTVINCPFCTPDDPLSYSLYHIPTGVLLPHIIHITTIGLATSYAVTGPFPAQHRFKGTILAILLLLADLYLTTSFTWPVDPNYPSPPSAYALSRTIRPVVILLSDLLLAAIIYTSSTARFFFLPFLSTQDPNAAPSPQDIQHLQQQSQNLLAQSGTLMSLAHSKLRALHVARSTVLRDQQLKHADDTYWQTVVDMEGIEGNADVKNLEAVWSDDDVQAALARTYGSGTIDVARVKKEADTFVKNVTKGLETADWEQG